jgi:hypothetical protein
MGDPAHKLHRLFYPRAVAVVGAKRVNNYSWLRNHINFAGPKYHVNTDESEWPGAAETSCSSATWSTQPSPGQRRY